MPESRPADAENTSRRAYELGRLRQSLLDALPAVALAIGMVVLEPGWTNALLASVVVLAAIVLRWMGKAVGRGVGPGLALAWIPLLLPTLALRFGHFCTATHCHDVCRAVCAAGGLATGFLLTRFLRHYRYHPAAWGVSGGILLLASTAGCHCVGLASLLAFVVGLSVSSALSVAFARRLAPG